MASLVDLSQVKDYLGITTTENDNQLSSVLESVQDSILQMVGDLSFWEKTIQVANTKECLKEDIIEFLHKDVSSIVSINGVDFVSPAKELGTDYILTNDGRARVLNLYSYIENNFGYFDVVYNAGWADGEVPDDFVSIVAEWVAITYVRDYGREVTRETMGPRTVEYAAGSQSAQGKIVEPLTKLKRRLRKYLPLHLRAW